MIDVEAGSGVADGGAALVSQKYDVFISYNSNDRSEVEKIVERLRESGIQAFMDYRDVEQGRPWLPELGDQIKRVPSAIVFIGPNGLGKWQSSEAESLMGESKTRDLRLCYALLRGVIRPEIPALYDTVTKVDFRPNRSNGADPFDTLRRVITGKKGSIFLALPTDDLLELWDELKKNLEDALFKVEFLDHREYRDLTTFKEAAEAKIKECRLFVQLLGVAGKQPEYLISQRRLVNKIPVVTWLSPDLNTSKLSNQEYATFLREEPRSTVPWLDFVKQVLSRASIACKPPDRIEDYPGVQQRCIKVFVSWEAKDQDRGQRIADIIQGINEIRNTQTRGADPEESRLLDVLRPYDWKAYLYEKTDDEASSRVWHDHARKNCDQFFVVHGDSPEYWVGIEVDEFFDVRPDWPLKDPYVICKVPPPKADWRKCFDKMFRIGRCVFIDCGQEIDRKKIYKYLAAFLGEEPMPDEF